MSGLTKKENQIAVSMLDDYSDHLSIQICNDYEFPSSWSDEEKTRFTKEYHDWNGDPEEYEQGNILGSNFAVAAFLSFKLNSTT